MFKIKAKKNEKKKDIQTNDYPDLFSSHRKDVKVLCAPDGVQPNTLAYLEMVDGPKRVYISNMYIDKISSRSGFAETYADLFNYPNTVAKVDIQPISRTSAEKMLDKHITGLDSELYAATAEGNRNAQRKFSKKISESETWAVEIENGENLFYRVGFLFTLYAETVDELNDACIGFYNRAKEKGIDVVSTYSIHPEAYMSNAPLNSMMNIGIGPFKDTVVKYHILDRYGLSTIYNHTQANFSHRNGILAGRNMDTGRPALIDPYDNSHDNYNMIVSGVSGVGKSATLKMWTSRWMEIKSYKFACIDFDSSNGQEGEYAPNVRAHGGVVYQIKSESENVMNPFEITEELEYNQKLGIEERRLYVTSKCDEVTAAIINMITNGKEANDLEIATFLDEVVLNAVNELYSERGIREGEPDSLYTDGNLNDGRLSAGKVKKILPTLSDLMFKLLLHQKKNKSEFHAKAYAIAIAGLSKWVRDVIYSEESLTRFSKEQYESFEFDEFGNRYAFIGGVKEKVKRIQGSKPYFDGLSTVDFDQNTKAVDIDLSGLPSEQDKFFAQQIAIMFIQEKMVKKNSSNPNKLQPFIFLIDEIHNMFKYTLSIKIIASLYRQARKRYVSMCTCVQALADYNVNDDTRAMVKNSSMKIMFKQDIMDMGFISEVTPLTDIQISRVTMLGGKKDMMTQQVNNSRKGELCLIDNNNNVVFIKVDYLVSTESVICETDPAKLARMMENQNNGGGLWMAG